MSRLTSRWATWIAAACGLVVLGASNPAWAIMSAQDNLNYFMLQKAQQYKYAPDIVPQWSFNTTLTETKDAAGNLTSITTHIDDQASAYSTAILIAPQYVLTVAHAVTPYGWFQYDIGGHIYRAQQWWTPAQYTEDSVIDGKDIAIVKLDRPVTTQSPNIPIMPYANVTTPDYRAGQPNGGQQFSMLGYGQTNPDTLVPPTFFSGGQLRYATNKFDVPFSSAGYLDADLYLNYDLSSPNSVSSSGAYEGMILPGDSGGPAIINNTVVGLNDMFAPFVTNNLTTTIEGSDTEVSRFGQWIRAIVNSQDERKATNQVDGITPTDWGYQTGIAGITIGDILKDLALPNPVLVPWLIANGYLNSSTGMSNLAPFMDEYSYGTGVAPPTTDQINLQGSDSGTAGSIQTQAALATALTQMANSQNFNYTQIANDIASGSYYTYADQLLSSKAKYEAFLTALFPNPDSTITIGGVTYTAQDFLNMNNFLLNQPMFGPNGIYSSFVASPEPASIWLLILGAVGLLWRRRKAC